MNRAQRRAVERIQQYNFNEVFTRKKYELKRFKVEEMGRSVFVVVQFGMKDDEGTMASVLCRQTGRFLVGPRGGIRAIGVKKGKRRNARQYPLIYGWD